MYGDAGHIERVKYLPFLIEVTKLDEKSANKFMFREALSDEWREVTEAEMVSQVQVLQNKRFVDHTKIFRKGQKFELSTSQAVDGVPRYSLIVIDVEDEKLFAQKTVGVFVVPLGTEREMDIFSEATQVVQAIFNLC